jgi:hypothetical protein
MSVGPASWSPRADPRHAAAAAGIAIAAFIGAWVLLHEGFYTRHQIIDTPIYQRYGDAMADGQVPYRDFALEYPPAALPFFVLPSLMTSSGDLDGYRQGFEALMIVCGVLTLAFMLSVLTRLDSGAARLWTVLGFAAIAPLLLGPVVLSRFDLWPAALCVGALAALVAGRTRLGGAMLGLGFAAKLYPALLLPLAFAFAWRRGGRREAAWCAGAFAVVAAAIFLPFVALSPDGVWDSLTRQTSRPLQIESLGSSVLLVAHDVFGLSITMKSGHGSQNLAGSLPDVLAVLQVVVQVAAVVAVWWWFARGPATRERLVVASAAVVTAFVAFGKVLSPQFLIWLIPLVPLVRGRRGATAVALLALTLVLTQLWFPYRYWDLALHFDALMSWLVLARDLVLVALFVALVLAMRPRAAPG